MCQCPQRASTYFFAGLSQLVIDERMCQCPQRASTYFLEEKNYQQEVE